MKWDQLVRMGRGLLKVERTGCARTWPSPFRREHGDAVKGDHAAEGSACDTLSQLHGGSQSLHCWTRSHSDPRCSASATCFQMVLSLCPISDQTSNWTKLRPSPFLCAEEARSLCDAESFLLAPLAAPGERLHFLAPFSCAHELVETTLRLPRTLQSMGEWCSLPQW